MEQQQSQQHHQKLHLQQHNQQNHQQQMQKQTSFEKPLNKRIELDQRDAWPHETQSERGYVIKSVSTSHLGISSHLGLIRTDIFTKSLMDSDTGDCLNGD